jgi:hypothetical protein
MQSQSVADDLLKAIPPSMEVRRRLADNVREARVLRQLLRLAESKERCEIPRYHSCSEVPA